MDIRGKRVLVMGMGLSGMAAARLLVSRGASVRLSDRADGDLIARRAAELERMGCVLERGGHTEDFARGAELIVVSPGVDPGSALLRTARGRGVPVMSEVELAYRFCPSPIIAVTGTNGKTTTVALIERMLNEGGARAEAAGNIGRPFCDLVRKGGARDFVVLEVSSFQLEAASEFRPRIAVALNVSDDHLDRYRSAEEYYAAKAAIFRRQQRGDWAVIRKEDRALWERHKALSAQSLFFFSARSLLPEGAGREGDSLVIRRGGERGTVCRLGEFGLEGEHNIENALAAAAAASLCGAEMRAVRTALREFRGLPHRMERVGCLRDVLFINDSKATNPAAALSAIRAVERPIVLIAGGRDKGFDYSVLREEVSRKVKAVVLIGEAAGKMKEQLQGASPIHIESDMKGAVRRAASLAAPGEAVMLSPACSSFDMYAGYEERGERFREAVARLAPAGREARKRYG